MNYRTGVLPTLLVVGAVALLVTGCAQTSSSAQPTTPADSKDCAASSPFGCDSFVSTGGNDNATPVAWLASQPLQMNFEVLNGSLNAVIQTPCNALNIPLVVNDDQIVTEPDKFVATAKGCIDDAGEKEAWTTTFMKSPLTFVLTEQTLDLRSPSANISFSRTAR